MVAHKHRMDFVCPDCNKKVTILELFADAKGNFEVDAICAPCGKEITIKTNLQLILVTCIENDVLAPYEAELQGEHGD